MRFVCYTEWDRLPDSADLLFAEAEKDSIFFSRAWLQDLVSGALEQGQSVLLACVLEGDQVLALLPMMRKDGAHLDPLGHLYTSLFTLLLAKDATQDVLEQLVTGLDKLQISSIKFDPVADDDEGILALQQALVSAGFVCHRHFRFYNWIHQTQGQSFTDYMAARPSRVRHTVARKQRKLMREHNYKIRVYQTDDVQQGLADYNAVYRASWKAHELFEDFIQALAGTLSQNGWLRLAVLYAGDSPVAAQFWFVVNARASIFKLHYDQDWKGYSPGSVLTSHLMQHVIDIDKVKEIDFLNGNDAYKQDWMSERRERWTLYCARPRPRRSLAHTAGDFLNTWARKLVRLSGASHRPKSQAGNDFLPTDSD